MARCTDGVALQTSADENCEKTGGCLSTNFGNHQEYQLCFVDTNQVLKPSGDI